MTASSVPKRWARSTSWAHWTRYWRCARGQPHHPLHRLRAPVRPQLRHTVCRGHTAADYAALLDTLAERLGDDRAVHFHAHFSRIAYTKGGEKCHLTFADTAFGPPHLPLLQLLKRAVWPPRSSVSRPAHRPRTPPRWPKAMRRCKFGKKYQISRKNICTGLAKLLSIL